MEEPRKELMMQVDGMTCEGCANAVRRTIQKLDPGAEVQIDLAHGRITTRTTAQALDVAAAINRAGYEARAMTL